MADDKKKQALEDILKFAKDKIEDIEDKPVKTFKMEKEWVKLYEEANEAKDEAVKLASKAASIREEMWAKIRRDLGYPKFNLHLNDEEMTIEAFESE